MKILKYGLLILIFIMVGCQVSENGTKYPSTDTPVMTATTPPVTPSAEPTTEPTPTLRPTATEKPTTTPNPTATKRPTATALPTFTAVPTKVPTETVMPTKAATETAVPTKAATETAVPTEAATETAVPTKAATETAVPTEAATEIAMPTKAATETAMPTKAATETAMPTKAPTATSLPTKEATPVIYRDERYTVVGVIPDDTLNLRAGAGVEFPVVTQVAPATQNIRIAQGELGVDNGTWVFVNVDDQLGWVNLAFLAIQQGEIESVALRQQGLAAVYLLSNHDMVGLSEIAHPQKGVRFVPQSFLSDDNLIFSADEVASLWQNEKVYQWGYSMGEGSPLLMTFRQYYYQFIYSADYLFADRVGYGQTVSHATTIENSLEIYPDATRIEYHFDGFDPQYEGLDWRTLRLLFEKEGDSYYLVAVIFSAWSP